MKRIFIVLAIVTTLVPLPIAVATSNDHTASANPKARIFGCEHEDSCTIDYRQSGVWVITHR